MRDHRPATETFRAREILRAGKGQIMPAREHAFRDLAKREVQHRQWRCREQHRQWEVVQVFQVKFDYDDGPFPVKEPLGCPSCSGQWLPEGLACPYHQFAIRESQLYELWQKWDRSMYPINPIEVQYSWGHEDYPSDSWLVPGSTPYFQFFGLD